MSGVVQVVNNNSFFEFCKLCDSPSIFLGRRPTINWKSCSMEIKAILDICQKYVCSISIQKLFNSLVHILLIDNILTQRSAAARHDKNE